MIKTKCEDNISLVRPVRTRRRGISPRAFGLIELTLALAWCLGAHAQQTATATAVVYNGSVAGVVVTYGGSGYDTPPAVTFVGGGGTGASAAAKVSGGSVTNIVMLASGSGYTSTPVVSIASPPQPIIPATLDISLIPMLTISGQPWSVQEVQYATSLGGTNQWVTLTNIALGNTPYVLVDTNAPPRGARFYQTVTLAATGPDPARWAWINPGTFLMGSPITEYDRSPDESPQTEVTFTNGFWMERFEVTQWEYTAVVGTNYSINQSDTNQPVENVSWYDASNYCALLTSQEQTAGRLPAGYVYRLATEAEWEYAYRAGTTNRFPFGDDPNYTILPSYSWFSTNGIDTNLFTHVVGQLRPNPWGIYDQGGNVWEWCADYYDPYPGGSVTNPVNPPFSTNGVVMRGGSGFYPHDVCRCAARNFNPPDFQSHGIGIRVVLGPPLH